MDELIAKLTGALGITEDAAKKAVGIILAFIEKEAPQLQLDNLLASIPGITELVQSAAADSSGGGLLGKIGGMFGGAGGDLMTAVARLTNEAGLQPSQIETVGTQIFDFLRSKLGDDTVDKMVAAVPGLSKFT